MFGGQGQGRLRRQQRHAADAARRARAPRPSAAAQRPGGSSADPLTQAPYAPADPGPQRPMPPQARPGGAAAARAARRSAVNHFELRDGELACEDVPLARIAEAVGTPVYVYSTATLERHFTVFRDAAGRASDGRRAADRLRGEGQLQPRGAGDPGAPRRRRRHGLRGRDPPRAGRRRAGRAASSSPASARPTASSPSPLEAGVAEINVESEPELDLPGRGRRRARACAPPIAIRVNPGRRRRRPRQDHHRPGRDDKFGVSLERGASGSTPRPRTSPALRPVGVACHIGSQITDLAPLRGGLRARCAAWSSGCAAQGLRGRAARPRRRPGRALFQPARSAHAGGLRARWSPRSSGGLDVQLAFEPGRRDRRQRRRAARAGASTCTSGPRAGASWCSTRR